MYRCEVCGGASDPRAPMIKHTIYKEVMGMKQIEKEMALCSRCKRRVEGNTDQQVLSKCIKTSQKVILSPSRISCSDNPAKQPVMCCDVCGSKDIKDGQMCFSTILCKACAERAREKSPSAKS